MRRSALGFLVFLVAAGALRAEEEPPRVVLRTPDPATEKRIVREYITNDGLGAGSNLRRNAVRKELVEIGFWAVPYLAAATRAKGRNSRVRMNAILTLALIGDRRCLPQLRRVAEEDDDAYVRQTATLGLGLFRDTDSLPLLRKLLNDPDRRRAYQPAAALALAKLRHPEAASTLEALAPELARGKRLAAAILLGAAIASPNARRSCLRHLGHKEKLVRRAAATGLLIRPVRAAGAKELLDLEKRTDDPLVVHVLGAIERSDEIRARLLAIARSSKRKDDERVAALIQLAREPGRMETYPTLKRALNGERANTALAGALLFALARTDHEKSVDDLLRVVRSGTDLRRFYAVVALIDAVARLEPHPRKKGILDEIKRVSGDDPQMLALRLLAGDIGYRKGPAVGERVSEVLDGIVDPKKLRLHRAWEERRWDLVNRLLLFIFALDDLVQQYDSGKVGRTQESSVKPGQTASGGSGANATPEELDLLDFFAQRPYFGPDDLGGMKERTKAGDG